MGREAVYRILRFFEIFLNYVYQIGKKCDILHNEVNPTRSKKDRRGVNPMKCPYCGNDESKVVDSRPAEEGSSIRRRREYQRRLLDGQRHRCCFRDEQLRPQQYPHAASTTHRGAEQPELLRRAQPAKPLTSAGSTAAYSGDVLAEA